jgi:hypothetical protein
VSVASPLQLRVVVDGPPTPAWQANALARLNASAACEVNEVRLAGSASRGTLLRLRTKLERATFRIGADPLAPVHVVARRPEQDTQPDVIVWLAESAAPDEQENGVLWLRHGAAAGTAEEAFSRAVIVGAPCMESDLLLRTADGARVTATTVSGVRAYSAVLSYTMALWKLAALVPRAVADLPGNHLPAAEPGPHLRSASGAALLARALVSSARALSTRLFFRRPWSIVVRERTPSPTAWTDNARLVRWGEARMHADPFLFEHAGVHHLFCEEVPRESSRGVISHTELRLDGAPAKPPRRVLSAEYHMSYPFVFAHRGEIYMIPETSAARRVELYRATEFPRAWEREASLLEEIDAADATLLEHDGRLWLFATVAAPNASSLEELHLFSSEELAGPWRAHPCNPVVSDVRCARPAGAIQRRGARLIRPAQDCSHRYGWAMSLREIDVLSERAYAEHEIERIEPADVRGARATHTYTLDSRFEAVDLRQRRLRARFPSRKPSL